MKKIALPIFIVLIVLFGTIIAFIATPEKKTEGNVDIYGNKILYFYSDTCSYCIKQKPILEELVKEGVEFEYMNVGEHREYYEQYSVEGTPTFIFKAKKLTGYQSKDKIKSLWEENK